VSEMYCQRCDDNRLKECHFTPYQLDTSGNPRPMSSAMGVLCTRCFDELTPEDRVPYYMKVYDSPNSGWKYVRRGPARVTIERAVMLGL
jgi:hypothetical protein